MSIKAIDADVRVVIKLLEVVLVCAVLVAEVSTANRRVAIRVLQMALVCVLLIGYTKPVCVVVLMVEAIPANKHEDCQKGAIGSSGLCIAHWASKKLIFYFTPYILLYFQN
jgi:hypothetical protein